MKECVTLLAAGPVRRSFLAIALALGVAAALAAGDRQMADDSADALAQGQWHRGVGRQGDLVHRWRAGRSPRVGAARPGLRWRALPAMAFPRFGFAAVWTGRQLLVWGGTSPYYPHYPHLSLTMVYGKIATS